MSFTSLIFFSFLIISVFIYYISPRNKRTIPLFVVNSIFIFSLGFSLYIYVLIFSIINYFFLLYTNHLKKLQRTLVFMINIIFNVLLLCYFKYLYFILHNIEKIFNRKDFLLSIVPIDYIAPLGISFFTFKVISLAIDNYKKNIKTVSLSQYLSYVLFFPQFLSGPIERFSTFIHSLKNQSSFDSVKFFLGFSRIIYGLFKKMVVADNLSPYVNTVFANPSGFSPAKLITAAYLFSFQLYFDFSGYSDMAIGIAKIFGFNTPENFNAPYIASSIKDFWRRWHISLSSWFKDYLYIPLGGNRKGKLRTNLNILIIFAVTGLWHGASWNFIVWGLLHGFYQIFSNIYLFLRRYININNNSFLKIEKVLGILLTFNFVTFAWIFFKSNNVNDALTILDRIFSMRLVLSDFDFRLLYPLLLALLINLMKKIIYLYNQKYQFISNILFSILILILIILFANYSSQDFLYFKF